MGFLHPLLLMGLAAVTVPVLIHLLLRQRPRPRPWAAMRWLLAAAQQASRRYKLTNLLLLLLRMLIVALIALAVSGPLLGGFGGGDRLVIVLDRTASMGARGADPGPLAKALAVLAQADLPYRRVALVAVDTRAELIAEGDLSAIRAALVRLTAGTLPGGLDRAAREPGLAVVLNACGGVRPDVVLISDFQQDHGTALSAALVGQVRQVVRWSPAAPLTAGANATVIGSGPAPDLLPGQGGEFALLVTGHATGVSLAVDDAPAVPVPAIGLEASGAADATAVQTLTVSVPPLPAGTHRLRVQLTDAGLTYDNLLELPAPVRPAVPVLMVANGDIAQSGQTGDYLGAALRSDERAIALRAVRPALIAGEPLAAGGLVALRAALPAAADAKRLAIWVNDGGVLWAGLRQITDDQALVPLLSGMLSGMSADAGPVPGSGTAPGSEAAPGTRPGGPWNTGSTADHDLDALLGLAGAKTVPAVVVPPAAEILLRAGEAPAVLALPAGRGWVIVELADLASDAAWQARGATPLWALRMARRYTARAAALPTWTAGDPAPVSTTIKRGSDAVAVVAGDALAAAPGAWVTAEGESVVVLPSRDEGRLDRPLIAGIGNELAPLLRHSEGADLGWLLALMALVVALVEGLIAAWAGRAYGR